MTWKDRLTPDELAELRRAEKVRDDKRDMYNAVRSKLKTRADARKRREKSNDDA